MVLPTLNPLDTRINAYTKELADANLQGKVDSARFVEGKPAQISVSVANLFLSSDTTNAIEAQLLFGQTVKVFDQQIGRCWVQADHNKYVGWLDEGTVSFELYEPTHRVCVPRTFIYPGSDLKFNKSDELSMGSKVHVVDVVENRGTKYAILNSGLAVVHHHLTVISKFVDDYVDVAETLLHTPYLWGGDSAFGIDCAGLVQLSMDMSGNPVQRDSDLQAATIGAEIDPGPGYQNLERGDLAFWRGHAGIIQGNSNIIHANGHSMTVASEPLGQAIERIAYLYEKPIGFRRP